MRKSLYTILLFFCCLPAFAAIVDKDIAAQKAGELFSKKSSELKYAGEMVKSSIGEAPAYYIFNNPDGGWVIIAGDDRCEPVLAYSDKGSLNTTKLPSNFKTWMNGIEKNVKAVRANNSPRKTEIAEKWDSPIKTAATTQTLLTTASWGQEAPYNNYCPSNCPTGCVATAMSIVMRHFKYPAHGTGTIPAYTTESNKYSISAINVGSFSYDWNNMPLSYSGSTTTEQDEAVARLMQHCGASVQMDYASSGSGAYSADIPYALQTYFGYSKTTHEVYRSNYSNNEWLSIIKKEIDNNRPIIYGGADIDTEDGHQFVLDGYDSNNMVHINWGWDGTCNAWYAVCYLGDKSSQGVNDVFSYYDSAIIGMAPDASGSSSKYDVELMLESDSSQGLYGLSLESGTIAKGSTFSLFIGFICNYDYYNAYDGSYKVGLFSYDGTLKQYVGNEVAAQLDKIDDDGYPGYTYNENYSCKITCDIALGDYLQVVYKQSDGSFIPMGGYHTDEFSKKSGKESYTNSKLGALDIAMLVVPSSITAGQIYYFDMMGSHKLPSSIKWYWDGSENVYGYVKTTSGKHTIKAAVTYTDNSTETIQRVVNVK